MFYNTKEKYNFLKILEFQESLKFILRFFWWTTLHFLSLRKKKLSISAIIWMLCFMILHFILCSFIYSQIKLYGATLQKDTNNNRLSFVKIGDNLPFLDNPLLILTASILITHQHCCQRTFVKTAKVSERTTYCEISPVLLSFINFEKENSHNQILS